jgi:hypothetical protein
MNYVIFGGPTPDGLTKKLSVPVAVPAGRA